MKILSNIISAVFTPLLVATYGLIISLFCTYMVLTPLNARWVVIGAVFCMTCLAPLGGIYLLMKMKIVSDLDITNRKERTIPFTIAGIGYFVSGFFLWQTHAPIWMTNFMMGAGVVVIIDIIITRWWKISAHTSGMGGLVALCFRIMAQGWEISPITMSVIALCSIFAAGLVGTARLYLGKHDLYQVLAGFACGFLCVYFISGIH